MNSLVYRHVYYKKEFIKVMRLAAGNWHHNVRINCLKVIPFEFIVDLSHNSLLASSTR